MNAVPNRKQLYIFIPNLNLGGAERVVVTLLRHIDRSKFDCCLVVLGDDKGALVVDLPADIPVKFFNRKRVLFAVPALIRLLWQSRPELVFSNLSHLNLIIAMVRFFLPKTVKFIVRESSVVSVNIRQYKVQFLWRFLYKAFYRRLDYIICQSAVMQHDIVENFRVPVKQTVIIHNPVDIDAIKALAKEGMEHVTPPPIVSRFRFVFVGGLRTEKRVERLLHAFARIPAGEACLDIVGDGPERQILNRLCKELALTDRVRFVGFQSNPYGWMKTADALLLTSDYEGAPNVVLEALALETPIISTPAIGGVREMLAGQPGCMVAEASTFDSFAKAMIDWLNLENKATSKRAVSNYAAARIARHYEDQFLGLTS